MDQKTLLSQKSFITMFGILFIIFLPVFYLVTTLLLGLFPLTKQGTSSAILVLTFIISFSLMLFIRWQFSTHELPPLRTSLKLVGMLGLLPLIAYGPVAVITKKLVLFSGVLLWLFVIWCVVYFFLKIDQRNPSSRF